MSARPFQIGLRDIFLAITLIAGIFAGIAGQQARISFLTLSLLGLFVWHRPIMMRIWLVTTCGVGSGLFAAMMCLGMFGESFLEAFGATNAELMGWGVGMLVGAIVAWRLLLTNPPQPPEPRLHEPHEQADA
jgi:hypothetical protein